MLIIFLDKIETDYKVTNNYIESLKKHIKKLHTGSKEELIENLETYDQNLTQKVTNKKKVLKSTNLIMIPLTKY